MCVYVVHIVTWWLKAGIAWKKEAAVAMQWHRKHISTAMNKHATTEKPWKWCFLCSLCWGYIVRTNGADNSQSHETVRYGHEFRRTRNQEWLLARASSLPDRLTRVGSQQLGVRVGGYQLRVLSCVVRCCYQATTSEVGEEIMFAVVICRVCRLVKAL
jgi:hypothetical protein